MPDEVSQPQKRRHTLPTDSGGSELPAREAGEDPLTYARRLSLLTAEERHKRNATVQRSLVHRVLDRFL